MPSVQYDVLMFSHLHAYCCASVKQRSMYDLERLCKH